MKLAILAAALLLPASAPEHSRTGTAAAPGVAPARPSADMPVLGSNPPGCQSILQQVAGENRKHRGTRLDQQPPAHMLLAVDRIVDGCREVTFVRRNVAPGSAIPDSGPNPR